MVKVIAIANQKGGVGKTTTAVNLSAGLAIKFRYQEIPPKRVLLIDLDAQMNALMGVNYGEHEATTDESLPALLVADAPPSIQRIIRRSRRHQNLHYVPSNREGMVRAAKDLNTLPAADLRLKHALEPILDDYEFIIIDTPPHAGVLLNNAIMAATHALIPLEVSYLGASGLGPLQRDIMRILRAFRRDDFKIIGYLPTQFEVTAKDAQMVLDGLRKHYGDLALEPIRRSRAIQQSNAAHMDIFVFAPPRSRKDGGLASSVRPTMEYGRLVDEIIRRTSKER